MRKQRKQRRPKGELKELSVCEVIGGKDPPQASKRLMIGPKGTKAKENIIIRVLNSHLDR